MIRLKHIIVFVFILAIPFEVIGQIVTVRNWYPYYTPGQIITLNLFSNDSIFNVRCNGITATREGDDWTFRLGPNVSEVQVLAEVYGEGNVIQHFETSLPMNCLNSSYIVSVGTGDNPVRETPLIKSPSDAKKICDTLYNVILTQHEGVILLNDCSASSDSIINVLNTIGDSLAKNGGEGKKVFVYLSGHGVQKDGFSLQVKANDICVDSGYINKNVFTDCFKKMTKTKAHVWVFLDACEANSLSKDWSNDTFENGIVIVFPANKAHVNPQDSVFANILIQVFEELRNEQEVSAQQVYNSIRNKMGKNQCQFVVRGNNGYLDATDEYIYLNGKRNLISISSPLPSNYTIDFSIGYQFGMQGPYLRFGSTIKNKWHCFVELQPTISYFKKEDYKYNIRFVGESEMNYRPSSFFGGIGVGFRWSNQTTWGFDFEVRYGRLISESMIASENIYGDNNSWITTTILTPPTNEAVIGLSPIFFVRPMPRKLNQLFLELGYSFDIGVNSKRLCVPILGHAFTMGIGYSL